MRRLLVLLLFASLQPTAAGAIGLQWASGSTALSFTDASRCTLVVRSNATEGRLPADWRLLWTSNGGGMHVAPIGSAAGGPAVAEVAALTGPASSADLLAHVQNAFLTGGGSAPTVARYLLDLPAGASGKIKLVALDPADPDSFRVLSSNVVTFNGGTTSAFKPVLLRAVHEHGSEVVRVMGVGSGLGSIASLALACRNGAPPIPLNLEATADTSFVAEGIFPDALPETELQLQAGGILVPYGVAPDVVLGEDIASIASVFFHDPDANVVPHDFALVYNRVPIATNVWRPLFHLIYTNTIVSGPNAANSQKVFRHTWTSRPDISESWHTPVDIFHSNNAGFDFFQIYAPSIIQFAGRYQMFYTGVNNNGEESIGLASTGLLDTTDTMWDQPVQVLRPNPLFINDPFVPAWVQPTTSTAKASMRDPFVLEDPDNPGQLLMYYVAGNPATPVGNPATVFRTTVGVVRSGFALTAPWSDLGFFPRTRADSAGTLMDESPHVFPDLAHADPGQGSAAVWRLMFTDGPAAADRSIRFTTALGSISDTTSSKWQKPVARLFDYLHRDATVFGWEATEYLHVPPVDFLGAYDGTGIAITRLYWSGTDFIVGFPSVSVPNVRSNAAGWGFRVSELAPGSGRVSFRIDSPAATQAALLIYDIMGRRICTVFERVLSPGTTTVAWDGHDGSRTQLPSGVYFAQLRSRFGDRMLRIPLVH